MKLLLNTIFKFTGPQRAVLNAACPGIELVEANTATPDQLDGTDIDILVTEQVPKNLAAWPRLRLHALALASPIAGGRAVIALLGVRRPARKKKEYACRAGH